jgi:predicted N-acetyltransferase YhbS
MAVTFSAERPEHASAIEAVLDRAFGPGRFAKTCERVRERVVRHEPALSRVAFNGTGAIIGVCRISWGFAGAPIVFLGPLAVDPAARQAGVGLALVREAIAACRLQNVGVIVLIGAESFFRPAGFSIVPKDRLSLPAPVDPARLLWLELRPGETAKVQGAIEAPR